jgi:GTP-binding protein
MFIDEAEIYIKAGKGGDGAVSFRREKYIPNGGPDGGDGGKGGNVIFEVDEHARGLVVFNREKKFFAPNGENGMGRKMHGKNSHDLVLRIPEGTQIFEKGELVIDLMKNGETFLAAKGGNGGWGNQHFATSIKQAPEWAKQGMKGESRKFLLVWKTVADIGLIGLPNAGKSTLLSVLTSARPKIADYPFTTLEPNLGTYVDRESRIVIADIPGLIEGASQGKGLGDKFLRHIERTKIMIHLVDAGSENVTADYKVIRSELATFSKSLTEKKEIIIINKADTVDADKIKSDLKLLKKIGVVPIVISAATHQNLDELIHKMKIELA